MKTKQHFCNNPYYKGRAISECKEDEEGYLVVAIDGDENNVDYCPFCGFKAKTPARKYNE